MTESIRGRLLKWHTVTVAAVVAVLGVTVAWLAWNARVADIDQRLAQRARSLVAALTPAGDATFDLTVPMGAQTSDWQEVYYVLWSRSGSMLDRSDPDIAPPRPDAPGVRTRDGHREHAVLAAAGSTVLVGRDLQDVKHDIGALAGTIVAAGLGVLGLSVAFGWVVAGRTLAPLSAINHTATRMAQGDLHARIPTERLDTELDQVGRALNEAFDELQAASERQRRFTTNASHELRTPLTTVSAEVQWALSRERTPDDYRRSLAVVKESADRIEAIVARLLALARAESAPMPAATVHVDDVIERVVRHLGPLATRRDVEVMADVMPAEVRLDPTDLDVVLTNVLSNAVLYNVPGGQVFVSLNRTDDTVRLSVRDTGVGIAATDQPRVFDPFFRTEQARSRDTTGSGLGLALTQAIIEKAGGTVACASELGVGTTVTIELRTAR